MKTVVIFGGSGFVAKHIIRQLAKNGYKIIALYQQPTNEAKLKFLGSLGQIIPIKYKSIDSELISKIIKDATNIINLKTSWDEKIESFEMSIFKFNQKLADKIIKTNKRCHLIYFSGLGVDKDTLSSRSQAILKSEEYLQKNINNCSIIRPGIIIGGEDKFLKGLIPLFKISPFIPLFGNGLSKFQPVSIEDVTKASEKIILKNLKGVNVFEFVGNDIFTYKEFYSLISNYFNKNKYFIKVPLSLVKLVVYFMDKTPFSPIKSEQLKLFEKDNVASNQHKNLKNLGINPQDLKEKIKKIILKNL